MELLLYMLKLDDMDQSAGNGLRNTVERRRAGSELAHDLSAKNFYQMCGMILWKARPAKHLFLHREELHHGETHMRAERRRG